MDRVRVVLAVLVLLFFVGKDVSGQQGSEARAQLFDNIKEFVQWAMENIKPDRVDKITDTRFASVRSEILKLQQWTGASGRALLVPIARSKIEPGYKLLMGDGLQIVGPGDNLIQAIVRSLDHPSISAGPPEQFEFSLEDSYFVWATVSPEGNISFQPQLSEATGAIIGKVKEGRAIQLANSKTARQETLQLYEGMIHHYAVIAADVEEQRMANKLESEFKELTDRLKKNEDILKSELSKARQLAKAAAFVDKLGAVLSFSALAGGVAAQIDKSDRSIVEGAKSAPQVKDALIDRLSERLGNVDRVETLMKSESVDLGIRTERMRGIFLQNGVPAFLDVYLKQPITYGTGSEFQKPR